MKIYDYKKTGPFLWSLVVCISFVVGSFSLSAQQVACINQVNVEARLDQDCTVEVTATTMVSSGTVSAYTFEKGVVKSVDGDLQPANQKVTIIFEDPDDTFELMFYTCGLYKVVVNEGTSGACWGYLNVEDKQGPVLDNPCPVGNTSLSNGERCIANCYTIDAYLQATLKDILDNVDDCSEFPNGDKARISGTPTIRVKTAPQCTADTAWYIYTFVDVKGNKTVDTLEILLRKTFEMGEEFFFPESYEGDCKDFSKTLGTVPPSKSGYPFFVIPGEPDDTVYVNNFDPVTGVAKICDNLVKYHDHVIPAHGANCHSYKIVREWKLIYWCGGSFVETETQVISAKDTTPPTVESFKFKNASRFYDADPWTCLATVDIDLEVDDDCNADKGIKIISLTIENTDGSLTHLIGAQVTPGHGITITQAPKGSDIAVKLAGVKIGCHRLYVQIEDCAGNISDVYTSPWFTVRDHTPPVAIAKHATVAALVKVPHEDELVAKVFAHSIDNGSYDHCYPVLLEVRRKDWATTDCKKDPNGMITPKSARTGIWSDHVAFCCEDVGKEIEVELRVTEIRDGHYHQSCNVGDALSSITWGKVKIEDNTPPQLFINDIVSYCHEDYKGLDQEDWRERGDVHAKAGCEVEAVPGTIYWFGTGPVALETAAKTQFKSQYGFDPGKFNYECNYGFAYLQWTAETTKNQKVTKFQYLEVRYVDKFSCVSVDWPQELVHVYLPGDEDDCGINVEELTWLEGPCEIIGWNVETTEFKLQGNSDDACRKLINQYTVINWCVFNWYITADGFGPEEKSDKTHAFLYLWYLDKGDHLAYYYIGHRENCNGIYNYPSGATQAQKEAYWKEYEYYYPNYYGVYYYAQVVKVFDTQGPDVEPQDDGREYTTVNCAARPDVSVIADDGVCGSSVLRYELVWWDTELERPISTVHIVSGANPRNSDAGSVAMTIDRLPGAAAGSGLPAGCYDLAWKVSDGCGNITNAPFEICVVDIKAPTPYCVSLSTALMIDGSVELWAADFDLGSFDECPVNGPLFFTFRLDGENNPPHLADLMWIHWYEAGGDDVTGGTLVATFRGTVNTAAERVAAYNRYLAGEIFMWLPNGRTLSVTKDPEGNVLSLSQGGSYDGTGGTAGVVFTCVNPDALYAGDVPGRVNVQMAVWDGFLNVDWCNVTLDIADNQGACDDGGDGSRARISGTIATEAGSTVASVKVDLNNLSNPEYKLTFTTGNDGIYAFNSNPMYNNYDIAASKVDAADNGVSTLDLVMIQRHILGITPFDSPYKLIAADINSDRVLSSTDIIVLRKVILGLYKEFPSNSSWRFVDAGQTLDMENALADFQEVINIQELEFNTDNQNFVAVKIGDVSGAASVNARSTQTNVRSANTLALELQERNVKAGELVQLTFGSSNFNMVYGYQFTFELNGLAYHAVSAGEVAMTEDNLGLLNERIITVSYSDVNPINASNNMFTMTMRATRDGSLKNMINITSSALNSEAYVGESLDIANVQLSLIGDEVAMFELRQNEPNPFKANTVIGFTLPEDGFATLTVYDVAGRVVTQLREQYSKGFNTVQLSKSQLGATGVLYYTLESGQYTATKKMIIIE